uniref:Uncharacterized protein n=1 Tax=Dunaliella tertiolecta TaxID=3047 RepID=A0A7S3VIF5_DUNTE
MYGKITGILFCSARKHVAWTPHFDTYFDCYSQLPLRTLHHPILRLGRERRSAMMNLEPLPHPYTNYNRTGNVTALVGNWVEEQALKDATGLSRFETWVGQEEPSQSVHATRAVPPPMQTHPRVIEHDEAVAPQDWETMYMRSHADPSKATTYPQMIEYRSKSKLGPRAQRELAMLMEEAKSLPQETASSITAMSDGHDLNTTHRTDYTPKDMSQNRVGTRVMRDQCGRPAKRDPTFLAETQLVPRPLGDRLFGTAPLEAGATQTSVLPDPDIPITIYTESVAANRYVLVAALDKGLQ